MYKKNKIKRHERCTKLLNEVRDRVRENRVIGSASTESLLHTNKHV